MLKPDQQKVSPRPKATAWKLLLMTSSIDVCQKTHNALLVTHS